MDAKQLTTSTTIALSYYQPVDACTETAARVVDCLRRSLVTEGISDDLGALPAPLLLPGGSLAFSREQRMVAALVAQGMSRRQIAVALDWPVEDVRQLVDTLMKMVRARNRAHFVQQAWRHGLLTRRAVLSWLSS